MRPSISAMRGDHIISAATIYGGTSNLFTVTMKKQGIDVTLVDPDAPEEEIEKAFRPNTKMVFGETIANPALVVLDIEKFARIAHRHGVPLIVDNTFRDTDQLPSVRVGRRYCDPFYHKIYGRTCDDCRRLHR